jgi:molecular chaperone GrpE
MSRSAAFGILRQASSSFSARQSTPAALAQARQLLHRRRYASESPKDGSKPEESADSGNGSASSSKPSAEGAKTASESTKETELAEKLKAKEAEVVDLTVRTTTYIHSADARAHNFSLLHFSVPEFILQQGRLRYLQADFLNLQRNAAREKEQTRDYAITRFASDLLETVDVLSLALKSIPESALKPPSTPAADNSSSSSPSSSSSTTSADGSSGFFTSKTTPTKSAQEHLLDLHSGVEITQKQLLQTLFKYGVKPFDPTGDKFDPNRHEALYQAPIPGKEPGTVLECQKTGYTIKDRTLRAAKVGVVAESS